MRCVPVALAVAAVLAVNTSRSAVAAEPALDGSAQTAAAELVATIKARNERDAASRKSFLAAMRALLMDLVERKATCPFVGSAVARRDLAVTDVLGRPLASIDAVAELGNTGGGDLGEVLRVFAKGNHAFLPDATGRFSQPAPEGFFSLDFPGSQGSHPGHSGILQGDPAVVDSGRFSQADFDRLLSRAQNGHVRRSAVGRFIAENLARDPDSKVFGPRVARLLASDLHGFNRQLGPRLLDALRGRERDSGAEERMLFEALTKAAGEDNLVGSSGEYGLLFAFLARSPKTQIVGGEPALSVDDLTRMFKEKRLPSGWRTWPKTKHGWIVDSTGLMLSAGREYLRLRTAVR